MAIDERLARRLVESELRTEDETVLDVRVGTAAVLVSTSHRGWRIEEADRIGTVPIGGGYRLLIAESALTDGTDPERAWALTADESLHDLTTAEGIDALWARARPRPEPVEIAALIAAFVDPDTERRGLIRIEGPRAADGPTGNGERTNSVTVVVFTSVRHWDDDDNPLRLVQRWEVTVARESVSWTVRDDE